MKPLKFDKRVICRPNGSPPITVERFSDHATLLFGLAGEMFFIPNKAVATAIREAMQAAEAAFDEASKLTLGDLKIGDWFRFTFDRPSEIRVVTDEHVSNQTLRWVRCFTAAADYYTTDKEVIRLKATFEVVE